MKYNFFVIALFISSVSLFAQKIEIKGKVEDFENKPVNNATVYLLKQKDSSIVNYTSTSSQGSFSLVLDELDEPSILQIEADKLNPFKKEFKQINSSIDLGLIQLERLAEYEIEEVKMVASPVKIKKDTIEFNAKALNVRPDSKIEELLKEIPGIEIDNDGKITANGKDVDQIMINGKPFFDKDGKIALQNLPADIIKNIQITTTKTKEEELTGEVAKSNNATINFNIDENKNKGWFGRITAGYGSDERYEGSLLLSYFKNDTKISLLASSNNINSSGFSNDEIFDSMGSGRNSWLLQGNSVIRRGNSTIWTSSSGGNRGITRSNTVGLNYSDKISEEAELENMSLIHMGSNTETRSKVNRTTLLPNYTLQTISESEGQNENKQYNFNTEVEIKPDSLTSINFTPSFAKTEGFFRNTSNSQTFKDGAQINENNARTSSENLNQNFNANLWLSRRFKKKGRYLRGSISGSFSQSDDNNLRQSETLFFNNPAENDFRNQLTINKNSDQHLGYSLGFSEPISDSASIGVDFDFNFNRNFEDRDLNDFDQATGNYSQFNELLSYEMQKKEREFNPGIFFNLNKSRFNIWASAGLDLLNLNIASQYLHAELGQQYFELNRDFKLPTYYLGVRWTLKDNKRLGLHHNASFETPSAKQLTPFEDQSNPLVTYLGNPELKNMWRSNTWINYYNNNLPKNINFYMNLGFNYSDNNVANYSFYDDSGKQFVTYTNINGNKSFNFGSGFSKTFKKESRKIIVNPRFNSNYTYNKGFIDGQQFTSHSYSFSPALHLTYEIKDKITVKPSYSFNWNQSQYENYSIEEIENTRHQLKMELTNYFFNQNLVFGNDFEYNTNSNIAPGFKKDFYFWNTSLGYGFFDKKLTAKVKIYDVLNQNQSVQRNITATEIVDREDLILQRYVMFSLTYKFNKFGNKPKQKREYWVN